MCRVLGSTFAIVSVHCHILWESTDDGLFFRAGCSKEFQFMSALPPLLCLLLVPSFLRCGPTPVAFWHHLHFVDPFFGQFQNEMFQVLSRA